MSDYNRGALSEPCMRLPYGFGGDWASIELGDGTGYVRLSEYEKVASDNVKLRELLQRLLTEYRYMRVRPRRVYLQHEARMRAIEEEIRDLGIEVTR